ncbi:MAG: hypothetical protein ACLSA6_04715 [Holdemania massiliensis]
MKIQFHANAKELNGGEAAAQYAGSGRLSIEDHKKYFIIKAVVK